jgi:hypothetical protein
MACAVIGDCIALGIAMAHPGCDVTAKMGRSPSAILQHAPAGSYAWAVISAGSNPAGVLPSPKTLRAIRGSVRAVRVAWVLPAAPVRAAIVRAVARERGDVVVPVGATARDRVHPRSYAALWRSVSHSLGLKA